MASVKEHLDALNHIYGKSNELWVVLYSARFENLPKLFNEVILLLKSNLFDDQQTRMIGTQDEEELINDYKFYIVKRIKYLPYTKKKKKKTKKIKTNAKSQPFRQA